MENNLTCPECNEVLMVDHERPEGTVYICVNSHRTVFLGQPVWNDTGLN